MAEMQPANQDASGVTRTPQGQIADLFPSTSTPASSTETIVRPPPTPEGKPQTTTPSTETTKTEAPADGKEAAKPGTEDNRSLIGKGDSPQGAPEKYEAFNVPEGFVIAEDVAPKIDALFKEGNLSQSYAQKLIDFYVKETREAQERPGNFYKEMRQSWVEEINKDADIGGSKLNGAMAAISKLIGSTGEVGEAFKDAMDYTGAGDHPAVAKFLYALAKKLTEGGPVRGAGMVGVNERGQVTWPRNEAMPTAAQAMYPNLPSRDR